MDRQHSNIMDDISKNTFVLIGLGTVYHVFSYKLIFYGDFGANSLW
jgi:hypothetical protein